MPSHRQPRPRSAHRGQGFTLIELLVVISIIAILAAMLMPAIGMVKASANASRCLSSQRQAALGCIAYSTDQEGILPALYLKTTPISIFWSHLILQDYLEARKDADGNHTTFSGTVLQGCSEWDRGRLKGANPEWESAFAMNSLPYCDNKSIDQRNSNYVKTPATAQAIALNQITKPSFRIFLGDALNGPADGAFNGQSTYLITPTGATVTEASNTTHIKSWHTAGNLATVTMFDGHGEKRSVASAGAALIDPK